MVTERETTMVAPNFVDAAVGAITSELLKALLHEIEKAKNFKSIFKRLDSMLREIGPSFVEIENLDRQLDRSDEEISKFTRQLRDGLDLVGKCAKVRRWDCFRKNIYTKKLEEYERSLLQWTQIDVQLQLRRDSSKLLLMFETNRRGANGGAFDCGIEFVGGCGAPGAPDFLVGLDEHLRELKAKLLDDGGEQVVVLSAPGGCGKTTLATKLCSDEEIKGKFKDNIFFVTFSKTPNLMVIVRELFQHKGYRVREFRTDEDAVNQLERILKQLEGDHILLVLDDVWPESESLIEDLEFNIPGYKILVTSRSKIDGFYNYELKLLDDQIRVTKRETSMVVPNFLDAAVGDAFSELLEAVLHEIEKAKNFNSIFKRLELTLKRIGPLFVEIENLDRRSDRSDEEIAMFTRQLQEGLDLVRKCAKIRRLDGFTKDRYPEKLEAFESSLLHWAQIEVQQDSSKLLLIFDMNRKGAMGGVCDDRIEFVGGCRAPGAPDFLVGLDEPLRELKAKLLDGGGEQVVVLSAPGGCGKTTLATKLCSDEEIKGIFKDNIFFVTFSKTPNLMVIVRELFQHMGYRVPVFVNETDAVNKLELMLKQSEADHILLVLDDVWAEPESLIEALEFNIPGYKVLVTSRSKIDGFYNCELKLLDDHDAMALFNHSAFPQDGNSCIPDYLVKRVRTNTTFFM